MLYNDYEFLEANGLGQKIYGLTKDITDAQIGENGESGNSGIDNPFKFLIP